MKHLCCLALLFSVLSGVLAPRALAQREYYNWYFGNKAGITFNNGSQALSDGRQNLPYHQASLSDRAGNFLFNTNGISVWDRWGNVVAGGDSIGVPNREGDVLAVPQPGSTTRYYIFNMRNWSRGVSFPCFNFSIVEFSSAGTGAVVVKDSVAFLPGGTGRWSDPVEDQAMSGFAAIRHANGRDIWVVLQNRRRQYISFLLTPTGLRSTPVVSLAPRPPVITSIFPANHVTIAKLAASADGRRLAVSGFALGGAALPDTKYYFNEVADFARAQGTVSNAFLIEENYPVSRKRGPTTYLGTSGLAFSPDGSKLYVDTLGGKEIWQYDMLAGSPAAIGASRTVVAHLRLGDITAHGNRLQLAPDGKIYVLDGDSYASTIAQPNAPGLACGFRAAILDLGAQKFGGFNLPKATNDLNLPPVRITGAGSITAGTVCVGTPLQLLSSLSPFVTAAAYAWDFGDPASGAQNTAAGQAPVHTYQQAGHYTVTLRVTAAGGEQFSVAQPVQVLPLPQAALGPDTALCADQLLTLSPGPQPAGSTFRWHDGSTSATLRTSGPGTYRVVVTSPGGCTATASISLTVKDCADLPNIITPNADGQNDAFVLKGLNAPDWRCRVFSRWGRLVFEAEAYQNDWNGAGQPAGVYFYELINRQTGQRRKGWVEVVR